MNKISYDVPVNTLKKAISQLKTKPKAKSKSKTNLPAGDSSSNKDLFKCPHCEMMLVIYDSLNTQYMCLNNKCSFRNDTLTPTEMTEIAELATQVPSISVTSPVSTNPIKNIEDLKGKIVKEVELSEDKSKLIIRLEGQAKEIQISIKPGQETKTSLDIKLLGKKQIITYEDIEEDLTQ